MKFSPSFRPLTGILFFNENSGPCDATCPKRMFPSPYGDFVFQGTNRPDRPRRVLRGFRPLTGILFFNLIWNLYCTTIRITSVSVPLRGFCFSTSVTTSSVTSSSLFPSPYGDFVFQLYLPSQPILIMFLKVSVPLRGFCFSTPVKSIPKNTCACFRPLTGILFFNYQGRKSNMKFKVRVSVPLRGFCFSTEKG